MTDIIVPLAGLLANAALQIAISRGFGRFSLLKSVYCGFAAGLLAVLLGAGGGYAAADVITYCALGYCYFHFINMGETARRVRLVRELADSRSGLTAEELAARYGAEEIISARLRRLEANGQIFEKNGRLYYRNGSVLLMAKILRAAKLLLLGKR